MRAAYGEGKDRYDVPCCVPGCGRGSFAKAARLCTTHYLRLRRTGTTDATSTGKGEVKEFLNNIAIPYEGDSCLEFPYARSRSGHGHVSKSAFGTGEAHVYVAVAVHGPKPSDKHEVCHSCGNPPCVNPKHLRWGTRKDNVRDAIEHGTFKPPPQWTKFRPGECGRTRESPEAFRTSSLSRGKYE